MTSPVMLNFGNFDGRTRSPEKNFQPWFKRHVGHFGINSGGRIHHQDLSYRHSLLVQAPYNRLGKAQEEEKKLPSRAFATHNFQHYFAS